MFKIKHQPLTTLLNYKVRVWLTVILTYVFYKRFLIFSYHTALIRQLSKTYGMVVFTLFHYMVLSNIFYLTLKISKSFCYITNYVKNKCIDCTKTNNILDLNGMSEVAWNFIFAIDRSDWNTLVTSKNNRKFKKLSYI